MKYYRTTFCQDRKGEWRWRAKAPNNRTLGESGEGFKTRRGCYDNAHATREALNNFDDMPATRKP